MQKGVPQIMDITSIRSVLHYLTKYILPSKFETAQQPEPNTIQLCFRGVNSQTWLEVSWNGDCPRILKIKIFGFQYLQLLENLERERKTGKITIF